MPTEERLVAAVHEDLLRNYALRTAFCRLGSTRFTVIQRMAMSQAPAHQLDQEMGASRNDVAVRLPGRCLGGGLERRLAVDGGLIRQTGAPIDREVGLMPSRAARVSKEDRRANE